MSMFFGLRWYSSKSICTCLAVFVSLEAQESCRLDRLPFILVDYLFRSLYKLSLHLSSRHTPQWIVSLHTPPPYHFILFSTILPLNFCPPSIHSPTCPPYPHARWPLIPSCCPLPLCVSAAVCCAPFNSKISQNMFLGHIYH